MFKKKSFNLVQIWTKLVNMSAIVFMFCLCLYNHSFICLLLLCMLFACSCQHMLNTFPFIQRTEQVLIELDISAIEEYVIIIISILQGEFYIMQFI